MNDANINKNTSRSTLSTLTNLISHTHNSYFQQDTQNVILPQIGIQKTKHSGLN